MMMMMIMMIMMMMRRMKVYQGEYRSLVCERSIL